MKNIAKNALGSWSLVPRAAPSKLWQWLSPVVALVVTLAVAAVLFWALGKDPLRGLEVYLIEPWRGARAISEVALKASSLILCAIGLAICFRSNVWNIGAEGQFVLGGICAGGLAMWLTTEGIKLSPWSFFPLAVLAGAAGGAAWAGIVALLRDRFNANEILVSLMLVYVATQILNYLVFGPWKDPKGFNFPQTVSFDVGIPRLLQGFRTHWGFVLALLLSVVSTLVLFRSFRGYQLQVGGIAPLAARYAGFSPRVALWLVLTVSGALAGVAGALDVTGPAGQLTLYVSVGYGFTAIIVAFVGRLHPLGCVVAAFLLSTFLIGGEMAQSRMQLPSALSGVFQGVLLFALLACDALIDQRLVWRRPRLLRAKGST